MSTKTLKDMLDSLPEKDRSALRYALEQQVTHHVRMPDGGYIGVNIPKDNPIYTIEQQAGVWSSGQVAQVKENL